MIAAQFDAHAKGRWRRLACLLSSAALTALAAAAAHAQMASSAGAAPAPAAPASSGTAPAMDQGPTLPVPTLRLSGFTFTAGASATETYTSNALGVGNGPDSTDAFYTSLGFDFSAHDHTARLDADLNYNIIASIYTGQSQYSYVSNYLTALANAIIIQDRLFLHASAFTAPILINGFGPLNAGAPNSGIRNTYGYTVSPDFALRFGSFAFSHTTLSHSALFFDEPGGVTVNQVIPGVPDAPDSFISYGVAESITSGPDFYRVNWGLTGSATRAVQGSLEYDQEIALANISYAIDRAIRVTGATGYDWVSSNQLSRPFSGAVFLAGLQFLPSPNFQASAQAGIQYGSSSYLGSLSWQIGAFTSLQGSLTDSVVSPGGLLLGNLANLGVNGSGSFFNTSLTNPTLSPTSVTNVTAFNPNAPGATTLTTALARYRIASLSLTHIDGRTQYRLTGYGTTYDSSIAVAGSSSSGNSEALEFAVSRSFTPRTSGSASLNYTHAKDFGNRYSLFAGSIGLYYGLSPTLQLNALASYSQRTAVLTSATSDDVSFMTVSIGIHKRFL